MVGSQPGSVGGRCALAPEKLLTGPVRLAESWLKLAGFVREKHCLASLMNSDLSGKPAGWSELFRPTNGLTVIEPVQGVLRAIVRRELQLVELRGGGGG